MTKGKKIDLTPDVVEWAHEQTNYVFDKIISVTTVKGGIIINGSCKTSYETGGCEIDLSCCPEIKDLVNE